MRENSSLAPTPKLQEPRMLTIGDIERIECALKNIGNFGEVHLVVERGKLHFIRTVKSESINGESNRNR